MKRQHLKKTNQKTKKHNNPPPAAGLAFISAIRKKLEHLMRKSLTMKKMD